eukprot:scaffold120636_cov52-Attheya_sp.AAC.2
MMLLLGENNQERKRDREIQSRAKKKDLRTSKKKNIQFLSTIAIDKHVELHVSGPESEHKKTTKRKEKEYSIQSTNTNIHSIRTT